ncbi:KXDL1 protein, partial [Dicaeum eximium]|nr:KXDL1 protein [Dicaeum eximium]
MEPTASQVFCGRVLGMVNAEDVNAIILAQKNISGWCQNVGFRSTPCAGEGGVGALGLGRDSLSPGMCLLCPWLLRLPTDSGCSLLPRALKGKLAKQYPEAFSSIHESPILEDDDDFDAVPKSTTTTIATSEQSTESCDTSPDVLSPATSQDFEDLSQGHLEGPAVNGQSLPDEDTASGLG